MLICGLSEKKEVLDSYRNAIKQADPAVKNTAKQRTPQTCKNIVFMRVCSVL